MSIQWTFIAGYLYFEIAVVILMMLPIFSPRRWHQLFKSRLFYMFQQHAAVYFYVLLGVLFLFLLDAVREMKKYTHGSDQAHVHLASEMKGSVKLFRAQRNFYITGFAIFLAFVIRRLVTMLISQDELSTKAEKIIKEAESTIKRAREAYLANQIEIEHAEYNEELKYQLKGIEKRLKDEQKRIKEIEEEAKTWKLKYEELAASITNGEGDK